jgi:hypothetical protein
VATIGGGGKRRVIAHQRELPVGGAMVTKGGRGRGRVSGKSLIAMLVAAHRPNIPDSLA